MSRSSACPQCDAPIDEGTRYCAACGVDVAFASLLAERQMLAESPAGDGQSAAAETIVPRLGDILIENGLITSQQLEAALRRQTELAAQGETRALGQTLVEMGVLSRAALDQVLTQQIRRLQTELLNSNRQLEQRIRERTAELQRALDRLKDLNQLKVNFVSNISHELRTPLAQMKGYLAMLDDGLLGSLSAEQADAVSVSVRASERLETLISDLIEFSVSAKGELTLNLQAISVQELGQTLKERAQAKAAKAGVELAVTVEPDLPPVWADRDKLGWVLFQLVDNAIKFTPSGGRVHLAAARRENRVLLAVHDTGIGIPENRIGELFEPFHQLDGSSSRRYGGTGLGLALVKRLVESHGSAIQLKSQEGTGSTFFFDLPALAVSAGR